MSLVEVTIALAILGFGILAAAVAQLSAMKFSVASRERTEAQYLAQQALEAYMAMPASVLATNDTGPAYSGTVETLGPDLSNGLSGQYQREFMIDADATAATIGVYTISVRVTWTGARGTSENVILQSFRAGA
jgi:Tfp pilus assembly protein PilV